MIEKKSGLICSEICLLPYVYLDVLMCPCPWDFIQQFLLIAELCLGRSFICSSVCLQGPVCPITWDLVFMVLLYSLVSWTLQDALLASIDCWWLVGWVGSGSLTFKVVKNQVLSLCLPPHRFWSYTSFVADRVYSCLLEFVDSEKCFATKGVMSSMVFVLLSQLHFVVIIVFHCSTNLSIYYFQCCLTLNLLPFTQNFFYNPNKLHLWQLSAAMFFSLFFFLVEKLP